MSTASQAVLPVDPDDSFPQGLVRDHRDYAAFYLNLSQTGGDIVTYVAHGRTAFLVNEPQLALHVLSQRESWFDNPYHPYRELAHFYTGAGSYLFRLHQTHDPAALASVEGVLVDAAVSTAATLACGKQGPVDLAFKRMMFEADCRLLFGIDATSVSRPFTGAISFIEECWSSESYDHAGATTGPPGEIYRRAIAVQDQTADWIAMQAGMASGEPTPQQRVAIIRTLLNSYNATATAMCWLLYLLARHPGVQEQCRDEVAAAVRQARPGFSNLPRFKYLRQVVQETLRLYPPAWSLGRVCRVPHAIGPVHVAAGSTVSVSPYTMHRLPHLWESPREFHPERFHDDRAIAQRPGCYFPFGGGVRRCPAGALAGGHIQLMAAAILQQWRIEPSFDTPVRPRGLVALRADPGVFVKFSGV